VVADEHRLPDPVVGVEATGGVGQDHRAYAGGGRGPHSVHDRLDAASLVEVRPAEEEQHPLLAHLHRSHLAAVPDGGRSGEAGQVADRDAAADVGEGVGRRRPAGAHHHRHVVRSAESGGEGLGRLGGEGCGVGSGRLAHAGTLTQRAKTVCAARTHPTRMTR
jgi:hypothetical protein